MIEIRKKGKKGEKSQIRDKTKLIVLIISIILTIYATYYFVAVNENRLSDGVWSTGCGGSVFPFPIDHGPYNLCPQMITEMSDQDNQIVQIYINTNLYVVTMILAWIVLGVSIKRFIDLKEEDLILNDNRVFFKYLERIGILYFVLIIFTFFNLTPLSYILEGGPSGIERDSAPYHTGLLFVAPVLLTYGIIFFKLSKFNNLPEKNESLLSVIAIGIVPIFVQTGMLIHDSWFREDKEILRLILLFYMILTLILLLTIPIIDYFRRKLHTRPIKLSTFQEKIILNITSVLILLSLLKVALALIFLTTISNECCSPNQSIISLDIFDNVRMLGVSFILGLFITPNHPLDEYLAIYFLMLGVITTYIGVYAYSTLLQLNKEEITLKE